jgi:hypothetical protein
MKTLNLYTVIINNPAGIKRQLMYVAAKTPVLAKKQTTEFYKGAAILSCERTGTVCVPLTLPAGL